MFSEENQRVAMNHWSHLLGSIPLPFVCPFSRIFYNYRNSKATVNSPGNNRTLSVPMIRQDWNRSPSKLLSTLGVRLGSSAEREVCASLSSGATLGMLPAISNGKVTQTHS